MGSTDCWHPVPADSGQVPSARFPVVVTVEQRVVRSKYVVELEAERFAEEMQQVEQIAEEN